MDPSWLRWVAGLALALLLGTLAQSQTPRRVALLIGNAAYTSGMPALTYPLQDIQVLEQSLKKLNFDVQVVRNADQKAMGRAIRDFGTNAREAQVALVYYSGHGMQARDENYLIPVGAAIETEGDLDIEAIQLRALMRQIEDARPKTTVVVLDACRDNPVASRTKSGTKGLSRVQSPPNNTLVVFAALPGTTATDNGVFAKELASRITEPNVGIRTVFDKVGQAVRQATGQKQAIQRDDQLSEDVVLLATARVEPVTPAPAPIPAGPTAEQIEQQAWDAAVRANALAGYQAYMRRYPNGRYAPAAEVAIAGLEAPVRPAPTPAPVPITPSPSPQPQGQAQAQVQVTALSPQPGQAFKDCANCLEMVVIPAGSFIMGSNEADREKPPHRVTIQRFAMGKFEVTQGQWRAVMGSNPSRFNTCGDDCPVEQVSWNDIQDFINKLNQQTGKSYRLPSEAEWEYAARAGSTSEWSFGDSESQLGDHAWFGGNSGGKTQRTGQKRPNAFGLHDMHGNVWEWVQDCWHSNYSGAPTDGSAWTTSCAEDKRVLRGGSWNNNPAFLRSALRLRNSPVNRSDYNGFRLARTL
jgi:formylglycine-generating enzyme required for sulfatase activity